MRLDASVFQIVFQRSVILTHIDRVLVTKSTPQFNLYLLPSEEENIYCGCRAKYLKGFDTFCHKKIERGANTLPASTSVQERKHAIRVAHALDVSGYPYLLFVGIFGRFGN